jgi:large subunit ribosomal protein L32e
MTSEEHRVVTEKQSSKKGYTKNKKPKFRRQESWRYKRVTDRWRKHHGVDSKMRKKIKGWPVSPTTGYRSPKKTRGIHPSGFVETLVHSIEDLGGIDPEFQAIRISRRVGNRKRVEISTLAEERGIHVLNPKTPREPEESIEGAEPESQSDGEEKI